MKNYNKLILSIISSIFLISFVSAFPQISNVSISPLNPKTSDSVQICANIIDNNSNVNVIIPYVNLHLENPLYNWWLVMDRINDNFYCKQLSPQLMNAEDGKTISYYLSAINLLNEIQTTTISFFTYNSIPIIILSNDTNNTTQPPLTSPQELHFTTNINWAQFCEVNWQCSGWNECNGEVMTRECVDTNNCAISYNKPAERASCEIPINSEVIQENMNNNSLSVLIWIAIILPLIVALVGGIVVMLSKRKKSMEKLKK